MPLRREPSPRPRPQPDVTNYHVFWFDDVADAVECCDRLVPHVVASRRGAPRSAPQPVVWFHVPRRSSASTRDGCYLLATEAMLSGFRAIAPNLRAVAVVGRHAIPSGSVLIFGEDSLPHERATSLEWVRSVERAVERTVERTVAPTVTPVADRAPTRVTALPRIAPADTPELLIG